MPFILNLVTDFGEMDLTFTPAGKAGGYDGVWAAAETWNDNFGAAPADIVRVAGGVVTELKRA
jgi:hypothetical protein